MTLTELKDWIYGEYDKKYDELEQKENEHTEGFTDGLLHIMAKIEREVKNENQQNIY